MQTDVGIHLAELTLEIKIHSSKKLCKTCALSWHPWLLWITGAPASLQGADRGEWVVGAHLLPQGSQCKVRAQTAGLGEGSIQLPKGEGMS